MKTLDGHRSTSTETVDFPGLDDAVGRRRPRPYEVAVFRTATCVGLLHGVDDGIVHREPGVPLTQHLPAVVVTLMLALGAMLVFPRLSPGARAPLAAVTGILALVNGSLHLIGISRTGLAGGDLTGSLAAVAGVLLVVLAGAIPVIHRRTNPRRGARR